MYVEAPEGRVTLLDPALTLDPVIDGKTGAFATITAVPLAKTETEDPLIEREPVALIEYSNCPSKPRTIAVDPGNAGGPLYPQVTERLVLLATL